MTEPVFAAPSDLIDSGPAPCDLSFMEVIGQKMRIPNRLKVTEEQEEEEEEKAEDIHLSTLRMQIPERISMGETEMQDIGARPYLYGWFHNNPSITDPPPLSISPNLIFGPSHALNMDRPESPVQTATTQHSSRSRALSENEICLSSVSRRQRNLADHSSGPKHPFPSPGPGQASFSIHNVCNVLIYVGQKLSEYLMEAVNQKMQRRNRFHNQSLSGRLYSDGINQASITHDYTVPEGVLENFSVMEIVTLRRQVLWIHWSCFSHLREYTLTSHQHSVFEGTKVDHGPRYQLRKRTAFNIKTWKMEETQGLNHNKNFILSERFLLFYKV
ncbi:mitochondrial fission factor-like [Chiloscyllium plagiosum]|uniref:mitochondrial fission factor-like n=1 Tax=Chiloscyllium plagiosum TaxID=36176 RepID=UPI001CB88342|nr:mitochondrial fission factor-like [Chiloscyllium plagiosum]